jgi:hypothetical protein
MDPSTTRGQARIQHRDLDTLVRTYGFVTPAVLAALERQRGWQADTEWNGLLAQVGVPTPTAASLVTLLRQTIGAALIRAGEHLAGTSRRGVSPETVPTASSLGPVG